MVLGGRVWPAAGPATAIAVLGDRILATGSDAELRNLVGPTTTVVDAAGGLIMPGFNDAHVHFLDGARHLANLELSAETTADGVLRRIAEFASANPDRDWLLGRGWFYAVFDGGMPHRALLDRIVGDRPVALEAYDSHTTWVNSAALARLQIDDATPNPPRGEIQRDAVGRPTGILTEAAMDLVDRALPPRTFAQDLDSLSQAIQLAHRHGLTSVQEAGADLEQFEVYDALGASGSPRIRIRLGQRMEPGLSIADWERRLVQYEAEAFPRRGDAWISGGIVKGYADGVIESGTAAMLAPYEGMNPGENGALGRPKWEAGELAEAVRIADARQWQVQIHAIGDGGVRMALDAYEHAAKRNARRDRRHRIEHIETVDAADIPRFGALGVVASMQPYHADPEPAQLDLYTAKIGLARAARGWPWNSIRRAGGRLAFGSDWPIVSFDPLLGLNSAVNRTTRDGRPPGGWLPHERLPLAQALATYTAGNAWAAHEESIKGTLDRGVLADIVVLEPDLNVAPGTPLVDASIRATILGGHLVYARNSETSR
ncbi:MAG: amidohydrolase [Candidatus Dormibacteraeota bacterium]|nr:amidohydrolase [Candidatus Dormibacteraeota bacterium]